MSKRTEAQLAHSDMIDTIRTITRLKHRISMRRELNEIEARAVREFERRLTAGEPYHFDVAAMLEA